MFEILFADLPDAKVRFFLDIMNFDSEAAVIMEEKK